MSQVDQILSGSVAFYPLGEANVNLVVNGLVKRFETAGVTYRVGDMSTEFKGLFPQVMALVNDLVNYATEHSEFVMDIKLSNLCGL
ncbi:MAG: hypothetical protein AVO33_06470 [delta proteobacterium ML8_F1]|nr:MAG: hypothetical protein AVO33_06470 [delta proteobacterium ML8_F1]